MDMKILLALCVLTVIYVGITESAGLSGACPQPSKVYSCSPKCHEDYECTNGRHCCPNSCNTKSCTESAPYGGANNDKNSKYAQGATGQYCGNTKCSQYEICKMDPKTNRMSCARS